MNIKRIFSTLTRRAFVAMALLMGGITLGSNTIAAQADLFVPATSSGDDADELPPQAMEGRQVLVRYLVRWELLAQESLTLNLMDDAEVVAIKTGEVRNLHGRSVWLGEVDGYPGSEVVLAVSGGIMMGSVRFDGLMYEIVYSGGGTHQVRQIDPSHTLDDAEALPDKESGLATPGWTSHADSTTGTVEDAGTVVDLMVVYTPQARNNAGGIAGIESRITNAVASANRAYLNSAVAIHLNLVHVAEIAYMESGDMSVSLSDLQTPSDGIMDEVHQWRDQYAADQVVLISADTNACGTGYQMNSVGDWFAPWAFSVVHDDSKYFCLGNYSLAHGLGHNQGSHHNIEDASTNGAYEYSSGYRLCMAGGLHTIMASPCAGAARVGHFSNPDVLYGTEPTGNAGFEDNALSLNNTAVTVANWRVSDSDAAPVPPDGLSAPAKGTDFIQLAWTDNADNETGFRLQRSVAGEAWTEIAELGEDSTAYMDIGLTEGTVYEYRIYAYNSVDDSATSDTLQLETHTDNVPAVP